MSEFLTKKDYVNDILKLCRTLIFCKIDTEDDAHFKKLIAFDLQKIGELENQKRSQVWNNKKNSRISA